MNFVRTGYSIINNMNESRDSNIRAWVLVIGILLIFSIVGFAVIFAVRESARRAQQAIQPVSDVTSGLSTQISQFFNPTPTILPDPITIISEVRSLARLETIQYSVEKVITAEIGQGTFGFLFGDRLLFVAHGVVLAGVDLEKMEPQDMEVRDGVLYVRLPEAEIFIASVDNERSYVYDRSRGALTRGDVNLETAARRVAEQEIANAALEGGVLEMAQDNAESFLYRLFTNLGYPDVIFQEPVPAR
jgi:hypothetical protein